MRQVSDLPRSAVVRAARLASLPLGMAGRAAWGLGKRVGGKPAELVAAELQARTAEQLFSVLGQLKGGAMKFGQALSIFESAFPEEMAAPYRAMLTKLQDSAPPLPDRDGAQGAGRAARPAVAAQLRRVRRRPGGGRLDRAGPPRRLARRAHGRGQGPVPRRRPGAAQRPRPGLPRRSPGRPPGYPASRSARSSTSSRAGWPRSWTTASRRGRRRSSPRGSTATRTSSSRTSVKFGEHVIVSEWIDGDPLSRIISEGTEEQRDTASQRYMEFLLVGPGRVGLLHADPHPGNFRLMPDGRLGVMDFGAVNRLPHGLPRRDGPVPHPRGRRRRRRHPGRAAREGSSGPAWRSTRSALLEYLEPFIVPLRSDTFRFSRPWLRDVFQHINDPRRPNYAVGMRLNLPAEYLLIHRVWLGGIGVLCQIGGEVPAASSSRLPARAWTCRRSATRWASDRSPPGGVELALDAAQVLAAADVAGPDVAAVLDPRPQ